VPRVLEDRPVQARDLRVYPIIDLAHLSQAMGHRPEELVSAAIRGGATLLQLREKGERASELVALCTHIRPWLAEARVPLVINDRLDLALATEARGLHLGQHDMPLEEARAQAVVAGRSDLWIGISVTTVEEAKTAVAGGASYLSVSPVFTTSTKPDTAPAAGLAGLQEIRQACPHIPIVAIGGIKPARVAEVIEAGADGVAFISAIGMQPEYAVRAMAQATNDALAARDGEASATDAG
jgi:thiamine-phosphate pyrophosphorylase